MLFVLYIYIFSFLNSVKELIGKKKWINIIINKSKTCLTFRPFLLLLITFQLHSSFFCSFNIWSSGSLYQPLLLPGNHVPDLFSAASVCDSASAFTSFQWKELP